MVKLKTVFHRQRTIIDRVQAGDRSSCFSAFLFLVRSMALFFLPIPSMPYSTCLQMASVLGTNNFYP